MSGTTETFKRPQHSPLNLLGAMGAYSTTGDDSNDLTLDGTQTIARGLYVGTAGNIKVTFENGTAVTLLSLAAGVIHPMRIKRVWATDLTAAGVFVFI